MSRELHRDCNKRMNIHQVRWFHAIQHLCCGHARGLKLGLHSAEVALAVLLPEALFCCDSQLSSGANGTWGGGVAY